MSLYYVCFKRSRVTIYGNALLHVCVNDLAVMLTVCLGLIEKDGPEMPAEIIRVCLLYCLLSIVSLLALVQSRTL